MNIPAGEFKAKCLKLMNDVKIYHQEIVITKHGKPVAKLVPFGGEEAQSVFGCMEGRSKVNGDIIKPIDIEWNAQK